MSFFLIDMDSSKYEQFINFLVDPERWTGRKFHLTDESHSEELQETAIQLGIEGDIEEKLWFVFLDACVDNPIAAKELYKTLGPWSSIKSLGLNRENLAKAKKFLGPAYYQTLVDRLANYILLPWRIRGDFLAGLELDTFEIFG